MADRLIAGLDLIRRRWLRALRAGLLEASSVLFRALLIELLLRDARVRRRVVH